MRIKYFLLIFSLLSLTPLGVAKAASLPTGDLIIEGGGPSSQQALQRIKAIMGAKRLCVITTANPDPSQLAEGFAKLGLNAQPIKITAANASAPARVAELSACEGFYFDGGLPRLLTDAFIVKGRDSLALATIRARFQEGAMVAGSSAGAMILGDQSLCTCSPETSFKVLHGTPPEIVQGFGFVHLIIDAHAFMRNLYGRELMAMQLQGWPKLLAIDESTAVEVPGDGSNWRVLGDSAVALIKHPPKSAKPLRDYEVSLLRRDDGIDPASIEAATTNRKADRHDHQGISEILHLPAQGLLQMAALISAEQAESYGWDWFWDPAAPVRLRLALTDESQAFENQTEKGAANDLLTHLRFSVQILTRAELGLAIEGRDDRIASDWAVPPSDGPRTSCIYLAMTPMAGPGVTTADRHAVLSAIQSGARLINALPSQPDGKAMAIPGSVRLGSAGACDATQGEIRREIRGEVMDRLAVHLREITHANFDQPLIFYCANELCWHSYNAAQRARLLGYRRVYWYRGGLRDWLAQGGAVENIADSW